MKTLKELKMQELKAYDALAEAVREADHEVTIDEEGKIMRLVRNDDPNSKLGLLVRAYGEASNEVREREGLLKNVYINVN